MAEVREEYLRALYDVSKADPSKWATFVEAFKMLVSYEQEKALSAPTTDALIAVGSGRRMRDLKDDFVHIETIIAKLKK